MKSLLSIMLLALVLPCNATINQTPTTVHVQLKDKVPHTEWNIPADMPDVYYDSVNGEITIVDYVNATYYVTIYDDWWNAVITDTKTGGGTINVSSLSSGDYTIEISTSWNHDYEGQFTVP